MKEKIVFIHGLTGRKRAFHKEIDYFSQAYHTYAYDLLGHGEDRGKPVEFTLDNLVEQLEILFDQEGIEKAHICSLSYGCYPATIFANKWKENVLSLCYIGGHYNSPSPLFAVFQHYWDTSSENYSTWLKNYARDLFPKEGVVDPYSLVSSKVYYKYGLELDKGILKEAIGHRLFYDLRRDLKNINVPVLWVMGDHDFLYKSSIADLKKVIPHVQYKEIPHAGHTANLFRPKSFKKIYEDFLNGIQRTKSEKVPVLKGKTL
ncbi:alpha/beta hydrolase [Bacillus methanolicus]|uniref:alpha/beta fold hydrolase n=1 Tax=Bacillus methanolicus TaxID=1471 RepID=UPI0023809DA5|nr:alpha/beta hydrolase [Bacillus methanolicus]MDE3840117.1 alpha/beta hydrolase [Bacillus methanolicus]